MNKELQKAFWEAFPDIFRERELPMTQTCMCWGLEIGDGWARPLWELCRRIVALQRFHRCEVIAVQVKEKFGELCFYYRLEFPDDLIEGQKWDISQQVFRLVGLYEEMSVRTCEVCGAPGRRTSRGGWIVTRCPKCLERSKW